MVDDPFYPFSERKRMDFAPNAFPKRIKKVGPEAGLWILVFAVAKSKIMVPCTEKSLSPSWNVKHVLRILGTSTRAISPCFLKPLGHATHIPANPLSPVSGYAWMMSNSAVQLPLCQLKQKVNARKVFPLQTIQHRSKSFNIIQHVSSVSSSFLREHRH